MNLSSTANNPATNDPKVWGNLKQAIATSSGFDKWQRSRHFESKLESKTSDPKVEPCGLPIAQEGVLDDLVRSYLRETLETLAY